MHTRQTPRTIPEKPNYWSLELGDKGVHNFRNPLTSNKRLLNRALAKSGFGDLVREAVDKAKAEGRDPETATFVLTDTPEVWAVVGAIAGLCWFNASSDLDTPRLRTFDNDVLAYGEEVLYELMDADYADGDIAPVLMEYLTKVVKIEQLVEGAKEQADFSEAQKDAST